jgi:Fe-S-cluster-containing dehydrogenase component
MAVNLDACIQCNLCVRACREVQVNDVIGMAGRGMREDRVRLRRPDGREHLRGLRRVRAGLPHRRADAATVW